MQEFLTQLEEFWAIVADVWQTGFLGYDIGKALVALGIVAVFFVLRGLFSRFVLSFVHRWTARTETQIDDYLAQAVAEPLRFAFVILGVFFAAEYLALTGAVKLIADNVVRSLIAVAIFWIVRNAVEPLSTLMHRLDHLLTREMIGWLVTGLRWGVILVGAATILQIWGIQVAPIIAGLGLFGVAVALGAQDLFKNLIGGISILMERRFHAGDWIKVDGVVEGTVEQIGFRSTKVRRFDKAPVFVPNHELSDAAVTNFTAMSHRRIYWKIGVEYRTTAEQLREIREGIEAYLLDSEDFAHPPEVPTFVRIDQFSDSSIDIMVYCFTRTTVWGEWLKIKEELAFRIKDIVEGAGTGFAFPSQSLYVETLPGEQPEAFVPPETRQPRKPALKPERAAAAEMQSTEYGDAGGDG